MVNDGKWDRRSLLRGATLLAGAAATAPLLGGAGTALASGGDADALFKAGKFEQAGRAYEEILKRDPGNVHAARQRGYVGLLGNKFGDAEKYLKLAIRLAPGDKDAHYYLADCYIRQDKLTQSAPHWKAAGEDGYAKWFAAVRGEAYQVHGDIARVPWKQVDPLPLVEASVNGGPAKRFSFYTGAPNLGLTASVAKEAGLSPVASQKVDFEGGAIWAYYGILESFKLGGIELRNVPVGWSATESGEDVGADSDGLIGTWVFYHLLTTFDYAGRQLILRRRTPEAARKARAGAEPLPLWLAREQYLHTTGSFAGAAGSRTGVVGVNLGGGSEIAAGLRGETAKQLGVRTDHDRQIGTFAQSHPAVVYPCYPEEIRVGGAVARDVYCYTNPNQPVNVPRPYGTGFDTMGWFSHCFWKPYNVTVDFTGMNLYIARGAVT
ncbi:aspartyl protease family protein [Nonomuraea endophytica]|uniref:Tetratricopeptide (TPR) repeat protein n=1 Tax=Nonomuraea endophytica TaxID=714136 RepID=A0A7W7ZXY6_9ACTN|nr:aspartyl protease family protein [Nonomuraea endophytica]MBB5074928.1 tetratricopeptide (TPR) repeat protein [Nonomuraea endophytica]